MSSTSSEPPHERPHERTVAGQRHSRWPGWIWAVPIAAIAIVGWLVLQWFFTQGPTVKVSFPSVADLNTGADVRYRGLKIGEISHLRLSKDGTKVIVTLSLEDSAEKFLRSGTRFWIVGASPNIRNLSSLKNIFAGAYIGMDPGPGAPTRHFTGLDNPPVVKSDEKGAVFILETKKQGSLARGAAVNYRGLQVGVVESVKLSDDGRAFTTKVFVRAPYDKLVHTSTRFWSRNAIQVTMRNGLGIRFASLNGIVNGVIAFETPAQSSAPAARPGAHFTLYDSKDDAENAPIGEPVHFLARFTGLAGDLQPGAAVKLRGFRVGQVDSTGLDYDTTTHELETPVVLELDPARFNWTGGSAAPREPQALLDQMMHHLVAQGLRAHIERDPPFIGAPEITLTMEKGARNAALIEGGAYPEIPTSGGGGIEGVAAQANKVLAKINEMPLNQIAGDLRATAARVRHIVSSPKIEDSIAHLDRALANIDAETASARGKVGPLIDNLNRAAAAADSTVAAANRMLTPGLATQGQSLPQAIEELSRAARAVRMLANYLDRHPEALIQGRSGGSHAHP